MSTMFKASVYFLCTSNTLLRRSSDVRQVLIRCSAEKLHSVVQVVTGIVQYKRRSLSISENISLDKSTIVATFVTVIHTHSLRLTVSLDKVSQHLQLQICFFNVIEFVWVYYFQNLQLQKECTLSSLEQPQNFDQTTLKVLRNKVKGIVVMMSIIYFRCIKLMRYIPFINFSRQLSVSL